MLLLNVKEERSVEDGVKSTAIVCWLQHGETYKRKCGKMPHNQRMTENAFQMGYLDLFGISVVFCLSIFECYVK